MPAIKEIYVGTNLVRPSSWDMSKWTLAQTSGSLSGTWWGGISLKPDGTKLFLTQSTYMREYALSSPFSISTLPSPTTTYNCTGTVEDIFFKPDGTKVYLLWNDGKRVQEYNLPTPRTLSGATQGNYATISYSGFVSSRGIYFTPDGKNIFLTCHPDYPMTLKTTLSTARDVTTNNGWTKVSTSGGGCCWFGNNGKLFFTQLTEQTTDLTYKTLSTAYDLSTATTTNTKNIGKMRAGGIWFNEYGTMCFMVGGGSSTNYVTKYTL